MTTLVDIKYLTNLLSASLHKTGVLVVQDNTDNWCRTIPAFLILNQRKGAVLQGTTTVSLRMNVGDFLELESTFHCNGLAISLTQHKHMFLFNQFL